MRQSRSEQIQNPQGRRSSRFTLQRRLVLFVLFIALVPLTIMSTRNIIQTQQALINGAEISLRSGASQTASSLDAFVEQTLTSIHVEAQFSDFITYLETLPNLEPGSLEQRRARNLLTTLSSKDTTNINSYALVDMDGNVVLDTVRSNIGQNESRDEYFEKAVITKQPIATAVTYSSETSTIINFASVVLDATGEPVGILRVEYDSAILQQVIAKHIGTATNTSVLLLDQFYIRMADTQYPDLILKSITPLVLVDYLHAVDTNRFLDKPREEQATNLPDFEAALKNAEEQPFFRTDITPDIPGDDSIAVAFMKTQPWIITYSRPTSVFLADVQRQINTNIILVVGTSIIVAILAALIARALTNPIVALAKVADSISQGDFSAHANVNASGEIGLLASAFNTMTDQLESTLHGLEQRVQDRTADLQKNTLQLETIADVAREIAIIRDLDTLLNVSVNLIHERLEYYHVGIFLTDERSEYAVLKAASSVAAEKMLESNYKLKVGQTGQVGNVTRTGQAYIALDVGKDAVHFDNPFLPETQSEITLPLKSHSITIGALDIQAKTPNAFGERDIQILQILADQLSAAIENAQLAQQVAGTLSELTRTNRLQTQRAWQTAISQREYPAYEYDGMQVMPVPHNLPPELLKQLEYGKPIVVEKGDGKAKSTLMVPLMLLNQVIGVIGLEQEDPSRTWTTEEIAVAQAAANRAALTLENARLLEESQRRAAREQAIGQISAKIGEGTEIEAILKTAIRELGTQIGDAQITVEIGNGNE